MKSFSYFRLKPFFNTHVYFQQGEYSRENVLNAALWLQAVLDSRIIFFNTFRF